MKVLVTGGGGFLGSAICRMLRTRGDEVVSLNRNHYPALDEIGVRQFIADIADLESVVAASKECEAIIHVAAKAGLWGKLEDYYSANVVGTANVLAACELNGINKLVYTSSPSVVHTGRDIEGGDESLPLPDHYSAFYPATKAIAEKRVIAANSPQLATVALRPHLIWGPGDNHLLPRLVARAQRGKLKFIGKHSKLIDTVYIDNAAQAHLNALDRIQAGAPCAGKAYFISQGAPIMLDQMVNSLLRVANVAPVTQRVPYFVAWSVGAILEAVYGLFRIEAEPMMTRFLAEEIATAHWFDISAAKRDLDYVPKITIGEGMGKLSEWWMRQARKGQ